MDGLSALYLSVLWIRRALTERERKERGLPRTFAWASGKPSLASEELSVLFDISSEALAWRGVGCGNIRNVPKAFRPKVLAIRKERLR